MIFTQVFKGLFTVAAISIGLAQVAHAAVARRDDIKASSTYDDGKWTPSSTSPKPTDWSKDDDDKYSNDGKYSSTVVYYKAKPTDTKYGGKYDGKDNYTSTTIWYAPKETGGKYDDKSGKDSVYNKGDKNDKDSYQDALDKHQDDVEAQLENTQEYADAVANSSDGKN